MEFIVENWYMIAAAIVLLCVAIWLVVKFFRRPSGEQVAKVKEWLLYAVVAAEKEFGGGTGQLKLRSVYDLFVSRFGWIAQVIPFATFSGWVDEALTTAEGWLRDNAAIANYVRNCDGTVADGAYLTDDRPRGAMGQMEHAYFDGKTPKQMMAELDALTAAEKEPTA